LIPRHGENSEHPLKTLFKKRKGEKTMDCFKGKVAIVTGGASGIGRAVCEALGKYGATTVVADINLEGAQEVSKAISGNGGSASAAVLDVREAEAIGKLIDETVAEHGRLDYMFNNAGINIAGEARDLLPEHWNRVLDINLMGVVHGTRLAYSLMVRQGFGHIVNTSSLCGLMPVPLEVPYATAKHAVVGLSTSLRAEGAALGVKVSVFCPGVIQTPLIEKSLVLNSSMEEILSISPLKIMGLNDALRVLLRGVARNQGIIICPFESRMSWMIYRLAPAFMDKLMAKSVVEFREKRRAGK
jgi:NAD(P)-dependent dehydrogenase (short-subunit alcohol dehydrogenase family)